MKPIKPVSAPSGAYIHSGNQDYQLYAEIPKSDGLVSVLEIDTDCPGRVFQYFMRGGIVESAMSVEELGYGATATVEMLAVAKENWSAKMRPESE